MNLRELSAITIYKLGLARWLFIHIPKNAGMAIRKNPELSNCLVSADPWFHFNRDYTQELAAYMAERGEHHGFQHARLRDIRADVRARLQPVAVVRNPWARVVSRYRFARTAIEIGTADDDYVAPTFEAFLEERHVYGNLPFYWHRAIRGWYLQKDYVVDEAGRLGAHVLRQEDLAAEATRYFGLKRPLPVRNRSRVSSERPWRDHYDDRTRQIVADWYAEDIDFFGFDFATGATQNFHFAEPIE
jgi:hypothetical protein